MMPGKFKLVVSDLHLSAGHEAEGNPLEDFGSDQEFATLLGEAAAESDRDGKEVELIVNGDAFEMLQVPHEETFDPAVVYPPERYLSSSEADSILKMNIIIDGHQAFFRALAGFIQAGPPRRSVTFIKGNHDVNLHWAGVQDRIRQAIGALGERRPLLTFESRRISREGIYVEHGNQYAEGVDRLDDMEEPHDHDKPGQLALPLGSYFVMNVFNKVERDKYWIDGVKPITALVWYALAYDFAFAAKSIATLARALPDILGQAVFAVDEDQAEALADELEDPVRVEELAARYQEDEAFRAQFNAQVASVLSPTPGLPGAAAFSLTDTPDPVTMGDQVRARVNSSLYAMAARRAFEEGVQLVTFGHTHDASVEPLPEGGVYINSGTWTWRADLSGEGEKTWRDLFEHPEWFTGNRKLNYVRIDYDEEGRPSGQLLEYELPPPPEVVVEETEEAPVSLWDEIVAQVRGLWKRIAG
jgi:UDP-2,3-diacylglucosamine pyrophosphatase LpxH